jgi:hypothetical protein
LALAALEQDLESQGLLCLEEPENGIHPARIPAMLKLLRDIATDVREEVGPDNPLRQVITNTHSPAVVMQAPDDSLVVAELVDRASEHGRFKSVRFGALDGTWRQKAAAERGVSRGELLAYLDPTGGSDNSQPPTTTDRIGDSRRVIDRPDLQLLLFPPRIE